MVSAASGDVRRRFIVVAAVAIALPALIALLAEVQAGWSSGGCVISGLSRRYALAWLGAADLEQELAYFTDAACERAERRLQMARSLLIVAVVTALAAAATLTVALVQIA